MFEKSDSASLQASLKCINEKQRMTENAIIITENAISHTDKFLTKKKEALLAIEGLTVQAYLQVRSLESIAERLCRFKPNLTTCTTTTTKK